MKRIILPAIAITLLAACNNTPKADTASTGDSTTVTSTTSADGASYAVDTTSTIIWTGSSAKGGHTGTFKVKDGSFSVKDNAVSGGKFTIDIATLQNQDLATDPDSKGKLEGHLKSPDFFDAEKYPTAIFEITSVVPFTADSSGKQAVLANATHTVTGNLTLKDQTKSVSFPAKITVDASTVSAMADFNIDRSEWGMNYKGPNNPQDWFISKTVNIKLSLTGTKK